MKSVVSNNPEASSPIQRGVMMYPSNWEAEDRTSNLTSRWSSAMEGTATTVISGAMDAPSCVDVDMC